LNKLMLFKLMEKESNAWVYRMTTNSYLQQAKMEHLWSTM
jgi:hypothetical protein